MIFLYKIKRDIDVKYGNVYLEINYVILSQRS